MLACGCRLAASRHPAISRGATSLAFVAACHSGACVRPWQAYEQTPNRIRRESPDLLTATAAAPLSHGDVLSQLLGVEGFLFAAISLAVTLSTPNQVRRPQYPRLKPEKLLLWAVAVLAIVGLGALVAWGGLYLGDDWVGIPTFVEGAALLIAVVAQPIVALLLTLAARQKTST